MLDKFLIIMASRGRPERIEEAIAGWLSNHTEYSDLVVALDDDDPRLHDYASYPQVRYVVEPYAPLCPKTERVYKTLSNYRYYALLNDDMVIQTPGFDREFVETLRHVGAGWGVAYGDDLFQHENLPTSFWFTANIPRTLGKLFPRRMQHQFCDVYYKVLGEETEHLFYRPDIVIEHRHVMAHKAAMDETYEWSLSHFESDRAIFDQWCATDRMRDILALRRAMQEEGAFA